MHEEDLLTIEEVAFAVGAKYQWNESRVKTLIRQLTDAVAEGSLPVRHPHTGYTYTPPVIRIYYEYVKVADFDSWSASQGDSKRLGGGSTSFVKDVEGGDDSFKFVRSGEIWRITHEGITKEFTHKKGFLYLKFLFKHPNEEFSATKLGQHVEPGENIYDYNPEPDYETSERIDAELEAADATTIQQVKKHLEELEEQKDGADIDEYEDIEQKIVDLKQYLNSISSNVGQPRKLGSSDEKERSRITRLIKTARDAIEKELPALRAPLDAIKTGKRLVYEANDSMPVLKK